MKQEIEAQKRKIKVLKQEISKLTGKIEELSKQIEEEKQELEKIKHDLASLLAKQVLGELPASRKGAIEDLRRKLNEKELRLASFTLAEEELQKRLEQAKETLQKALLELFSLYRDHFLSQLKQDFKSYNEAVVGLSKREATINATLIWVRKWEEALSRKLQRLGLEFDKAARTLGPLGASQLLDSSLSYVEDGTIPQVKDLDELVRQGKVIIPVEESFTQVIPPIHSTEENFWPTLERALGLE